MFLQRMGGLVSAIAPWVCQSTHPTGSRGAHDGVVPELRVDAAPALGRAAQRGRGRRDGGGFGQRRRRLPSPSQHRELPGQQVLGGRGGARVVQRRPRRPLAGFLALQAVAAYAPARPKPARLRLGAATLDPVDLPPQRRLGKLDEGIVRTARSWITEQCFRGWLRDTTKKGCLELDTVDCLEVVEPDECDIGEGLQRQRCPDVIRFGTSGFSWLGFQKLADGGAKLKATQLETELVNMHRRVLTRGRRGSFRAQLTMTGRDLDASAWIRARLDRVVRRVLTSYMGKEIADDEQMQFRTTIERDGRVVVRGAARVVQNRNMVQTPFFYYARRSPPGTAPFRFAASFRLVCEGGAVLFKEPDVYLPDRPSFEAPPPWLWAANPGYAFGLAHAPTSLVEFGQSLFLSSVTVDPTTSFSITSLEPSSTTPGALQVSVEAGPSLAPSRLPTKLPSLPKRRLFKKKKVAPQKKGMKGSLVAGAHGVTSATAAKRRR